MTIVVQSGVLRSAVQPYVGAADLTNLTSPYVWCGLRAWKTADIATGSCIDICDASGNNTTAIGFDTNGLIKTTGANSVQAWIDLYGSTVLVKKLYDQSGSGTRSFTPTAGDVSKAPTLSLTGGPSNGPCIVFSASSGANSFQTTSDSVTTTQPFVMSMVYRDPGTVNKVIFSGNATGGEIDIQPDGSLANKLALHAGATISTTSADATWHSANILAYSTSSFIRIDSTASSPANAGNNVFDTDTVFLGHYLGGGFEWGGKLTEFAVWNSDVSAEFAALSSNQHTAWGF